MTIEEKAKRYDEVSKKVKDFFNGKLMMYSDIKQTLNYLFPELAESEDEDERIRKKLIDYINRLTVTPNNIDTYNSWIAWLEKQGKESSWKPSKEQINALEHFVKSIGESGYASPYDNNLNRIKSLLNDLYKLERQGEYVKPTDKREPKFHEGDWVVNNDSRCIYQVKLIRDNKYCIWPLDSEVQGYLKIIDIDNECHLWTIQDAKDGDVLCVKYGNDEMPFIFTGKQDDIAYCALNSFGEFVLSIAEWLLKTSVLPATKEQCNLLFSKMKEAGYEWDADKKELKITDFSKHLKYDHDAPSIIEQKSTWGDEDEENLQNCCGAIDAADYYTYDDKQEMETWLKSLKERLS